MPTSQYFNHFNHTNEQDLVHTLTQELIEQYGIDVTYLPRERLQEDLILGESVRDKFSETYDVEMLIESSDSFEGEAEIFSNFGIELKDRVNLAVNPRRFTQYTGMEIPLEGDLIYFPLNDALFEITYVPTDRSVFYPHGTIPFYSLQCELFKYGNEEFDTGDLNIDDIADVMDRPSTDYPNITNAPVGLQDWISNHRYIVGDVCRPTSTGHWTGLYYKAVQVEGLGLSGTPDGEPHWPSISTEQVVDNQVLWEAMGVNNEADAFEFEGADVLDMSDFNPFNFVRNE